MKTHDRDGLTFAIHTCSLQACQMYDSVLAYGEPSAVADFMPSIAVIGTDLESVENPRPVRRYRMRDGSELAETGGVYVVLEPEIR